MIPGLIALALVLANFARQRSAQQHARGEREAKQLPVVATARAQAEVGVADATGRVAIAAIASGAEVTKELFERIEALERARDEDRAKCREEIEALEQRVKKAERRAQALHDELADFRKAATR